MIKLSLLLGIVKAAKYYIEYEPLSWDDALRSCRDKGGSLVQINSHEEQTKVYKNVNIDRNQKSMMFWIGLTDQYEAGNWKWVNEDSSCNTLQFSNFYDHRRKIETKTADCSAMVFEGYWTDFNCR